MTFIDTLIFDVGGVCLGNGWDHRSRRKAAERFFLDFDETEKRHLACFAELEINKISLDDYLDYVVFYQIRPFSKSDFIDFMKSQSYPIETTLALLERIRRQQKYLLGVLNNECEFLNRYRLETFGLTTYFRFFFSSCFIGLRKPDPAHFRTALNILQKEGSQVAFIDDREENVESAMKVGFHGIHFVGADKLEADLNKLGVHIL